ncbi:hypothetical protein LSG31_22170 [Fodinisporobacter ferrooxydans]|uniref:Uncharacterized protein n=1 Tax=Fodinisporobacter ferrooxydans TaxID=2901836 RepID=A0ABY4CMX1_9BACL|nr:hypothetical protein LSG31_22170 [Alicyclobacillaceae bacterium MYW30-H2]
MHIPVRAAKRTEQGDVAIQLETGKQLLLGLQKGLAEGEPVSLRFAAARFGQEYYLVIGIRKSGRGFDVLLPPVMWDSFLEEVSHVRLISAEDLSTSIELPFDEEAFQAFLDQCQLRFEDDPSLEVIGKIVEFFS